MMKLLTSILASVCCTILKIKSGIFSFFKDKNFSMSRLASALKHTPAQSEAGKWVIMLRAFGYCFNKSVLVMRLQKNDSGEIRSNKLETILLRSLTAWTQSQTKHRKCQASLMDASACLKGTQKYISINDVVQKGEKLNHAKFVIKKASKLNFIKVFETVQIEIAKNSLPDEKSRARCKHRPKLLRQPGNLQKIFWSEIHGSLEEWLQHWVSIFKEIGRELTSNTISIGRSINPFKFPRLFPDPLVRYLLQNIEAWTRRFLGTTRRRKRSN